MLAAPGAGGEELTLAVLARDPSGGLAVAPHAHAVVAPGHVHHAHLDNVRGRHEVHLLLAETIDGVGGIKGLVYAGRVVVFGQGACGGEEEETGDESELHSGLWVGRVGCRCRTAGVSLVGGGGFSGYLG